MTEEQFEMLWEYWYETGFNDGLGGVQLGYPKEFEAAFKAGLEDGKESVR